jgi:hypothetical protein
MGYLHNGVKTGGLPIDYIQRFVDEYGINVFIETGTAGGDSVRSASYIFEICHSIEIVDGRPEGEFSGNVTLHNGDSASLLKSVSQPYKGDRIVFWLDAHWSEPYESPEDVNECPVLEEITAIKGHDCLVLIDDARLFFGAHPYPGDPRKWPKFQQVFDSLRNSFPKHLISVVDDYIIAVPDYMQDTFHNEWRERFKERYPEAIDRVKMEMRNSLDYLKKFIG